MGIVDNIELEIYKMDLLQLRKLYILVSHAGF